MQVKGASTSAGASCTLTYEYGSAVAADLNPRIVAAVTVPTVVAIIGTFIGCAVYRHRKRKRLAQIAAAEAAAAGHAIGGGGGTDEEESDEGDNGAARRQLVYPATQPAPGGAAANPLAAHSPNSSSPLRGTAPAGGRVREGSARGGGVDEDPA